MKIARYPVLALALRATVALLLLAPTLHAQTRVQSWIDIPPQQCVFHVGDNPAWAAPGFSDHDWQAYSESNPQIHAPHLWIRCHADLGVLRTEKHPAVQIYGWGDGGWAYEVYLSGRMVGGSGDIRTGRAGMDTIRTFPIPPGVDLSAITIALRATQREPYEALAGLSAADADFLQAGRAQWILSAVGSYLPFAICFGVVGIAGILLFVLYLYDRSRLELLLLSIVCAGYSAMRIIELCHRAFLNYPDWLETVVGSVGNAAELFQFWFYFRLARRRVPRIVWVLIGIASLPLVNLAFLFVADPMIAMRATDMFGRWLGPAWLGANFLLSAAPWFAFFPWRSLQPRMRPLAVACLLWGSMNAVSYGLSLAGLIPHLPSLWLRWHSQVLAFRFFTTAAVVFTLLGLLFREQRRATEERALLSGEMQAARELQQRIVPAALPPIDRFDLDAAYLPAAEVGGDFYQVLPQPGGSALVVIGDVSGKGLRAAMTGALVLGALRTLAQEDLSPSQILSRLNAQLFAASDGGFVTCLVAHIASDGALTVANAGHLPPYRNGEEIPLESGLPLGPTVDAQYAESGFQLAPGDTLTFLSDGVVEAQNETGQLFGFDRAREISRESAEEIARAASTHGQSDDITVLTLTFVPAAVTTV
jgi:phosphoserine phosphatase RsbU/P